MKHRKKQDLSISRLIIILHIAKKRHIKLHLRLQVPQLVIQFSNVLHIKLFACYKMDSMPNFRFLLTIENEETKDELTFQQNDNEEDDQDYANCE